MQHLGNLTGQLSTPRSELRQYLDARYPHIRSVTRALKPVATPIIVPPATTAHAGTIGTAFDLALKFVLDPTHEPIIAQAAFMDDPVALAEVSGLIGMAGEYAAQRAQWEMLARACWGLARCVEAGRIGRTRVPDLVMLETAGPITAAALYDLAEAEGVEQIGLLLDVFVEVGPFVAARSLGPILSHTRLQADADLVTDDGVLVEVKTSAGAKRNGGNQRVNTLSSAELLQVVCYALLDFDDALDLRGVGIYSARYGVYSAWPLTRVLSDLRGASTDVATERAALSEFLVS